MTNPVVLHTKGASLCKSCCIYFPDGFAGNFIYGTKEFKKRIFREIRSLRSSRHHTSQNYRRSKRRIRRRYEHLNTERTIAIRKRTVNRKDFITVKPWYRKSNTSRFRGVSWHKRDKRYIARFRLHGKSKHIGYYKSELRAALEFDKTMLAHCPEESSKLNFKTIPERMWLETYLQKIETTNPDEFKHYRSKDLNGYPNTFNPAFDK